MILAQVSHGMTSHKTHSPEAEESSRWTIAISAPVVDGSRLQAHRDGLRADCGARACGDDCQRATTQERQFDESFLESCLEPGVSCVQENA